MWNLDTRWFDVALIMTIFAIGNIVFGHFEEHRPKWRRLLKVAFILGVYVVIASTLGRSWALALLGILLVAVLVVHAWWLPKHGINGLTGEPKERYYKLIGVRGNSQDEGEK